MKRFPTTNVALGWLVLLASAPGVLLGQEDREAFEKRTAWFREARFGVFIHFGLYAQIGEGEWIMLKKAIPAREYEKLASQFQPSGFSAKEWVALAKRAGAGYIVLTTKHHDGFCLFDSKLTEYDVMSTPFRRDLVGELAKECRAQGLRFGAYYSILDWHHPDYLPAPAWEKDRKPGDFSRYLSYMRDQLIEICTKYQPDVIWYDGGWEHKDPASIAEFAKINAALRKLRPGILINDRANVPEDFGTPEQYIPPTGLTRGDGSPRLWENCITMTAGRGSFPPTAWWGYDKNETEYLPKDYLVRMLVDVASKGGNLLLNVGPKPDGTIQPEFVERLETIGQWMFKNKSAICGTSANPFRYLPFFGRATVAGDQLFVTVFDWPAEGVLRLPGLTTLPRGARLLVGGGNVSSRSAGKDVLIAGLPADAPDPVASVLVVDLAGPPMVEPMVLQPDPNGVVELPVLYSALHGRHGQRARFASAAQRVFLDRWTNVNDWLEWEFEIGQPGKYAVSIEYSCPADKAGAELEVAVGKAALRVLVQVTKTPTTAAAGVVELTPGSHKLTIKAVSTPHAFAANLFGVQLKRLGS